MSYTNAKTTAIQILLNLEDKDGKTINERIKWLIETMIRPVPYYNNLDYKKLESDLIAHFNVVTQEYKILEQEYNPWLAEARSAINFRFWPRYKDYLIHDKGMAPNSINQLDNLTDEVLDRLANPNQESGFDKRGMVVGHVQSGKTGNYTGLICKAADAGYKLIVVLAGIHNSLRSQTQQRLDEGFLGFSTQTERTRAMATRIIGVGKRDSKPIANSITYSNESGDFKRSTAQGIQIRSSDPLIAVVKKNSAVLGHLIRWMYSQAEPIEGQNDLRVFKNLPILIIDDEADNATINTSKENVTAINGRIRALMSLFEKRAYVGYTATPFANIFIPYNDNEVPTGLNIQLDGIGINVEEDLFPRDFIVNIPAPSNYIGPNRIFGLGQGYEQTDPDDEQTNTILPLIRIVNDFEDTIPNSHKRNDELPTSLPPSLLEAVRVFIISTAVRLARGNNNFHSTMLVHVTRFTNWQNCIGNELNNLLRNVRERIIANSERELAILEKIFKNDFIPTTQRFLDDSIDFEDLNIFDVEWQDVREKLHYVASKTEVRIVHGGIDENSTGLTRNLAYHLHSHGLYVIAVGGDKLSRGLTLEGLCISYFLRASKMYDTLMQMGRWFGYRPGYADVCRLYTSEELVTWYRHIALASDELRQQFDQMSLAGRTPKDFGLRVMSLPGVLQITAVAKLRHADKIELSYSDSLIETHTFAKDQETFDKNFATVKMLIDNLGEPTSSEKHFVWCNISPYNILDFLRGYQPHETQLSLNPERVCTYIQNQIANRNLIKWTVVLINKQDSNGTLFNMDSKGNIKIRPVLRAADGSTEKPWRSDPYTNKLYKIKKGHIISPTHESIDLTKDQITEALNISLALSQKKWDREKEKKDKQKTGMKTERPSKVATIPSGPAIRNVRSSTNGLLLLYPLDPKEVRLSELNMALCNTHPLMGYAISFPRIANDLKVSYLANKQFLEEFEYPNELDLYIEEAE